MKKIACLFPGQGSQHVGMGFDLFQNNSSAHECFESMDNFAGRSLTELCFKGPEEELKRTINTQPTILAVSLSAWNAYLSLGGPKPHFVAGHSLGEFSALVAASALSVEAAVKLVCLRASLMENCPKGAMSAVLGLSAEKLELCCSQASSELNDKVVIVANFNTAEQLVISGHPEAVDLASTKAKELGAKVIALPVGGAFHSPLMNEAAKEFSSELTKWKFDDAKISVVQNYDGLFTLESEKLKDKLELQMASSVRWYESITNMINEGVETFIEIGPGRALSGMVKKINRKMSVYNISDLASLHETLAALKETASV